ncbi:MAG TPA: serine/threonine-protein kinase, partial [Thermoanaerobaculia bacterium]|nr:serine/threonine-protein kinase [Thermoanaerobaculia bacterium]
MIGADRWREVDRLFAAALDLPPDRRPAWLDEACAGRPELRQAIERLLAADARRDSFLDQQPGAILTSALAEEGECLGPYRLLRPLGQGGMGTVYLAVRDDAPDERQVAVKILHSGLENTALRHRFLAERQILARLDHPGIARLYTVGGTADGRPYLVMERIEGEPVDAYCDRHRLSVDQRLALFRKICAAVEHAHRHLLVHRDLKPANILVTPEGEPKLLDFGIAKQLAPAAESARTRTGLRVMTPSYASPEQVKGEAITTASDVYSLGVLLCELLCGRGPYPVPEGAPLYEIERAILEKEPERPSEALFRAGGPPPETLAALRGTRPATLRRRLAGDLDTIVLKALRKDPAQRYESVSRLSSDLERHLRSLPISARPDTWGYRTRKLLRRHRAAAATAAAVLLLTAGLVVSLLVQSRRIARERDKARHTLSFLVDTFKQADPRHLRGERLTAREVLDQGADRVSRELAGQPEVQSAVMDAIGEVNLGLGRDDQAAPMLEGALALRRRTLAPSSLEVALSLRHLASLRVAQSDFAAGETLLRQALAIERRRLGDSVEVASTLNQLGQTLTQKGDFRSAEPLHHQALAIARQAEGPRGPTVAEALLDLARCRDQSGDYPGAEMFYQQGLALEKQLLGERNPAFAKSQAAYGSVLMNQGKFKPAEAVFRRSLAIQRQALGEDHPEVAQLLNNLAESRHGQGDLQGAETLYRQALAGLRKS